MTKVSLSFLVSVFVCVFRRPVGSIDHRGKKRLVVSRSVSRLSSSWSVPFVQ